VADPRSELAAALQDRYIIERELGRGGMATVYLATDVKHDRSVALKVLHPELAASLGPERFQREIKLAARLQHPHILTVHDSGEAAGRLWFTMPFVEGESLRDRLRRERQLGLDDALRIAREAALALQYAHDHGVVHRDIKPENILLTKDGSTLVADFGIARALGGEGGLTETGMAVGTPAYMSPEQASAERNVDARTDVYSLGAVVYEMLAGEPPYTGPTAQAVIMKRFSDPVPSIRRVRPGVPEATDAAIQRALAPVPGDRFATAAELARALQPPAMTAPTVATPAPAPLATSSSPSAAPTGSPRTAARRRVPVALVTLALGFAIGLGVLFAWRRSHAGGAEAGGREVVAVLPFDNLGDSSDAYFADGLANEVRSKLTRVTGLTVIARASSEEYRRSTKRPEEIARELGADYLLTATVEWQKGGGASRVRVTPELVQVAQGHAPSNRWGQAFDVALTDVFQVQADIATKVASALDATLGDSAKQQIAARPTANLGAYDLVLRGEALHAATDPPTIRRSVAYFEQAVALDSGFVRAWVGLARAHSLLYANSTPTPLEAEAARHAAERAAALAPDRAEGHWALGHYYSLVAADSRRAYSEDSAALALAPGSADVIRALAFDRFALGDPEGARTGFEQASRLDPRSAIAARGLGDSYLDTRRYPEAAAAFDRALALEPTNLQFRESRAMVELGRGDLAAARRVLQATPHEVDPAALAVYVANYWDLYWVLEDTQQQLVLSLPPSAFDDDRGTWSLVRAQIYALRGDVPHTRIWADTARAQIERQLRDTPDDFQRHAFRGLALAYLGRKAEAIGEGERGVALMPIERSLVNGAYARHQLARIYLLTGEPEKALDQLDALLKVPYSLSPGWLRIDPNFAPLKGNPRFERLIAGN
jgi:serine/threonine-protein kinase